MKLNEVVKLDTETETEQPNDHQPDGTYAAVRFSERTKNAIEQYQQDNNIANSTPRDQLHATLLYSRKYLPNYQAPGDYQQPMKGETEQLELWHTQPDENGETSNCLVLRFKCDDLYNRHHQLMDQHQATYDFPEYIPHITFSYDVGDIDVEQLPPYEGPIDITHEYQEKLTDTLQKNTNGE